MIKAEIVNEIAKQTKFEKSEVLETIEAFIKVVKNSITDGENVYLRGESVKNALYGELRLKILAGNQKFLVPVQEIF